MKTSGSCPKCTSTDLLRIESPSDASHNLITMSWRSAAQVTRYLCVKCGFSEEWVEDSEDRAKLVAKYRTP